MKKLLNATFLVSGTAIGAGLISLPLTAVNLGIAAVIITVIMIFVAYRSSMMTIELNTRNGQAASIVELSRKFSGSTAFAITLASFYILSFSLLTVYFFAIASSLNAFFAVDERLVALICGAVLFVILGLNVRLFSSINSALVIALLVIVVVAMCKIGISSLEAHGFTSIKFSEIPAFLPVILTSFGVQNICANVYGYLNGDKRKIRYSFLLGILIPAAIYIGWNYCVFKNVLSTDVDFLHRLQAHQVSVGELIKFLCESSKDAYIEVFLEGLTLLAIITSAIGMGAGLLKSIRTSIIPQKNISSAIVCLIPVILAITVPNAFINVLSFGGMIATTFVIFVPYYLLQKRTLGDLFCLLFGATVVLCELLRIGG